MPTLLFSNQPGNWRGVDFPKLSLTRISWDNAPDNPIAFVFFGHINVDFDGSSTAYGPPGLTPPPDDDLSNAGDNVKGWYGVAAASADDPLVQDGTILIDKKPALLKKGKYPIVQQAKNDDPNPGYYVSSTPHALGPYYRQDSYIDASQVAFGALSGKLKALGVNLGDYALAIRHDQSLQCPFYFVDSGANTYALGECSHKVGKELGGSGRASHFNNNFPVSFIVFVESGDQDPSAIVAAPADKIAAAVRSQMTALSAAINAHDLALLMAFNEVLPNNQPQGKTKLEAYKAHGGAEPKNLATVNAGLQAYGLSAARTATSAT